MTQNMSDKKEKLIIEFSNREELLNFCTWLCNCAEQHYWEWCDYGAEDDKRPAVIFDYHQRDYSKRGDDPTAYKEFMEDNTIRTRPLNRREK